MARILLVDDEPQIRRAIEKFLAREGHEVEVCADGEEGLGAFTANEPDLVITDIRMPGLSGLDLLEKIRASGSDVPVVVLTALTAVETAVEAMKLGADDYICKPPQLEEISIKVARHLEKRSLAKENRRLQRELDRRFGFEGIIGESRSLKSALERLRPLARDKDISVLVIGESGTGKELVARAIHQNGPRRGKPFVALNCAALPENLIESELFGHERGAFTGAHTKKKGLFEAANGGTLFLDEISSMPGETQAKLLRALEDRSVRPVGGTEATQVDIRLVSAANRDLLKLVDEGGFRNDLYFRIAVATVELPPLRERDGDVRILAQHFLSAAGRKKDRSKRFGKEVLAILDRHPWPGNVRELENLVEMLVVTSPGDEIMPEDLPESFRRTRTVVEDGFPLTGDLKEERGKVIADFEKRFILENLGRNRWNVSKTAEAIGISRPALHSKMNEYGLNESES